MHPESLDFQDFADSENMVVVLPESGVWNMMGMEFFFMVDQITI